MQDLPFFAAGESPALSRCWCKIRLFLLLVLDPPHIIAGARSTLFHCRCEIHLISLPVRDPPFHATGARSTFSRCLGPYKYQMYQMWRELAFIWAQPLSFPRSYLSPFYSDYFVFSTLVPFSFLFRLFHIQHARTFLFFIPTILYSSRELPRYGQYSVQTTGTGSIFFRRR